MNSDISVFTGYLSNQANYFFFLQDTFNDNFYKILMNILFVMLGGDVQTFVGQPSQR